MSFKSHRSHVISMDRKKTNKQNNIIIGTKNKKIIMKQQIMKGPKLRLETRYFSNIHNSTPTPSVSY